MFEENGRNFQLASDHPGVLVYEPLCESERDHCPATPGCLVIVALSPHYYSGHQHEDNPTLPTSGAPGLGKCSHQRKIQTFILQKYLNRK